MPIVRGALRVPDDRAAVAAARVLVVEDMPTLALTYAAHLEHAGYAVTRVASGAEALRALGPAGACPFDAMLLDLQLPDADGLDLLRNNPAVIGTMPVVVATANGSMAVAIAAMRLGAFDFLVKPLSGNRLIEAIGSAIETGCPATRTHRPRVPDEAQTGPVGTFVGSSSPMREVYRQIACIAPSRATVFITGESGTGKEVCAEALHRESGRAEAAFVALNCGAIPENLLESELFGHVKGAFTGAIGNRTGAAQAAHKGTLFLDEICEMALPLQVKLLRFLQTGTIQPVGAARPQPVDVRIVCATNRDPATEVREGRFREDLFYRLAVVPLHLPPLRERGGDIGELAQVFLARFAEEEGKRFNPLTPAQIARLTAWPWPGNVRELQNVMRRAAVMAPGPLVPDTLLPVGDAGRLLRATTSDPVMPHREDALSAHAFTVDEDTSAAQLGALIEGMTLDRIERIVVDLAIRNAGGSLPGAARALGLSPSTLYRKRERWLADDLAGGQGR